MKIKEYTFQTTLYYHGRNEQHLSATRPTSLAKTRT